MKKTMKIDDVPEVQRFVLIEEHLQAFVEEHDDVFEQYQELVAERNAALESADKAVRALDEVECGPWKVLSTTEKVNNEKLVELIGEKKFKQLGGRVATRTETDYVLDKSLVLAALAKNEVDREKAQLIGAYKKEVRYKAPKAIMP